jgi:hypothetical protein
VLKISGSPITQNSQISNLECHSDTNDGNTVALANGKSLTYVKRKSNQLVASSNPCASSVQNAHNTSSDSYYKRRKNQLIRTSLESQIKQTASIPDESLNSEGQTALNSFSRNFSKRRLRKGVFDQLISLSLTAFLISVKINLNELVDYEAYVSYDFYNIEAESTCTTGKF